MKRRKWLLAIGLIATLAVFATSCGGNEPATQDVGVEEAHGDEHGTEAGDEHGTEAGDEHGDATEALVIELTDFAQVPGTYEPATAKAGVTRIETLNTGKVEHQAEIYATDADPAALEVEDGLAITEPLGDEVAHSHLQPGERGETVADLEPGRYALVCNIPGHYEAGMFGTLVVK